jgi:PAS domain S-box-containing protein
LNGDILFANTAMANLGNLDSFEDLKDRNIIEFYNDPTDREKLINLLKKEGKVNQFEMEMVSDFGEIVNVLITAQLSGDTILGMIIDTTEKKKAETALLTSENKYRALFDNAADGIFLMKGERFVECNERVLEIYGVTRDQIIGQTPLKFSPELQPDGKKSQDKAMGVITQALQGNPQHFEWEHFRYDGTPFYAEVSLNRVKIEEEYVIQAIVRDVTERKKSEGLEKENIKLQELDKLKSMFIASMSHELRTPLNSIIGFTGIILQGMSGELNEEQLKQLNIVKNSANHLLSLINDVIDISKIEAGKVELFIEDFDLSLIIGEIEESFMDAVNRKGLKMSVNIPGSLLIRGDERRTKQVIMNLVSNAIKFTEKGDVAINVVENKGMIEISVKDTGMGIRAEDMGKLFQAFSRIYVENQPMLEGTGLGLYLSKKIADLLGGNIQANSQFNVGSEFIFIFPVKYSKSEVI